jgi:2-phospho-L-lactate guanylyltransferase (CobY/MobA/RfbA family)
LWRTREPFAQSLLVTRDSLVAHGADGKTMTRLNAAQEPALRAVNQTLFALLSADLILLGQHFAVEAQLQGAQGWRLVLLPRDRQITQWLERVELEGDRFVRQVQFSEKSGDTTQILFSRQQTADALSADEEAAFA